MNPIRAARIFRTLCHLLGLFSILVGLTFSAPPPARALAGVLYAASGGLESGSCASWAEACELRHALVTIAQSDDEIWAMAGAYLPTADIDRNASFGLKPGVGLYGGFAGDETSRDERDWVLNETILSGDIGVPGDTTDNAFHVVTSSGVTETAVLDGFTVTGGNAEYPAEYGGGMYNANSNPVIIHVTFIHNQALFGGGIANETSSPIVSESIFLENVAIYNGGGIYNSDASHAVITGCTVSGNTAYYGGGFAVIGSSVTVADSTFNNNYSEQNGGGVWLHMSSSAIITNSLFDHNIAELYGGGVDSEYDSDVVFDFTTFSNNIANSSFGGGLYLSGGTGSISNSIFSANQAYVGGGAAAYAPINMANVSFIGNSADFAGGLFVASFTELSNLLFSGNSSEDHAGGLYVDNQANVSLDNATFWGNQSYGGSGGGMFEVSTFPMTITNSIFWENSAAAGEDQIDAGNLTVTYSLVQGGYPGVGNIDADPLFVDADGADDLPGTLDDDLRLGFPSPAIDAGDNTALPPDSLDLDGDGDTAEPLPLDLDNSARRVEVPGVPDTGLGEPPLVDLGAYEFHAPAPWVEAGADQWTAEGSPVTFTGVYTSAVGLAVVLAQPIDILWDFGDGGAASGVLTPTHTYADEGVYSVTLTVTDALSRTVSDQLLVTASNQAPQVGALADWVVSTGETVSWTVQLTDPGWLDAHTLEVAWEPGANQVIELLPGVQQAVIEHVYPASGSYIVTVTVSDEDGGAAAVSAGVLVNPVLHVTAGPDQLAAEGAAVAFMGAFSETRAQAGGALAPLDVWWDFGDGATAAGVLTPTHAYADEGVYTVTLVVTGSLGEPGVDSLLVTVNNVAPQVEPLPGREISAGEVVSWTVRFTDPGWLDAHTLVVSWEPGVEETFELPAGVYELAIAHRYNHSGVYPLTVSVSDGDGGSAVLTPLVTVKPRLLFLPIVG